MADRELIESAFAAIRDRDVTELQRLLEQGLQPNAPVGRGKSLLRQAVLADNETAVAELLRAGADPNLQPGPGVPPLCGARSVAVARLLIVHGADVNARVTSGYTGRPSLRTPLMAAAFGSHADIVMLLLEHGADPNLRDLEGQSALTITGSRGRDAIRRLLLDHGAEVGLLEAVELRDTAAARALMERGWDLHSEEMTRATCPAAATGDVEMLRLLLDHGADIEGRDRHGTPLMNAAAWGRVNVARELLAHGADVNARHGRGATPLLLAILGLRRHKRTMIELLLSHGADVTATSDDGRTLLSYAAESGFEDSYGPWVFLPDTAVTEDLGGTTLSFEERLEWDRQMVQRICGGEAEAVWANVRPRLEDHIRRGMERERMLTEKITAAWKQE